MNDAADSGPGADEAASGAFAFEQFQPGLYRYLLRRLRNAQNAQDLTQEVYLRLLRATDLERVKSPQAYLYRIAFNVLYEFRLRERETKVVFDSPAIERASDEMPDEAAAPEESYESGARTDRFERIAAQLPPMQRAVLRLATQHNLAHAEIADKLGIAVSTVRNHLYKAIDHCRRHLADTP